MKALILAAGFGKRLLPLTKNKPKAMLKVLDKPIIEHTITWLKNNNVRNIAINLHYLPEKIKDFLGNGSMFGVNIIYSYEPKILGTAGAVKRLHDFLDENFFVIYGDTFTDIDLNKLKEYHEKNKSFVTLCIRQKSQSERYSNLIELNLNNKITNYVEKPDELITKDKPNIANCGIYYCNKDIIRYIPEGFSDFSYDIFPKLVKNNDVYCYKIPKESYWYEIGRLDKYNKLKESLISS